MNDLDTVKETLPSDWNVYNTNDLLLDKKGAIKIGPFGSQLKKENMVNTGYKVYGQENVIDNDFTAGDRFVAEGKFIQLRSCELKKGDVVISMMGTIGKCEIAPDDIEVGIMDSHLLRLQINPNVCDKQLLRQLIGEYELIKLQINRLSVGGIMDGLSSKVVKKLEFYLPPIKQQQKIAKVLSTVDKLIEKTQSLIDKYTAVKQGMMADLFTRGIDLSGTPETNENYGQLRPNVTDSAELYQETELGWIPKDWELIPLDEHFHIKHGYAFKGEYFSDKPPGEVLLTPGNFFRNGGLYFQERNTKYYKGPIPKGYVLENGELLVVMTDLSPQTLILGRFVLLEESFITLHNQRIGKVERLSKLQFNDVYLLNALSQESLRKEIISTATGTTVRHSSPQRILNNKIPYPSINEQLAIGERVSKIESLIRGHGVELEKYKEIKKGLMQDLLTGKVRVN